MWKNECTAEVTANIHTKKVTVINHSEDWLLRPFGNNESPTIGDLFAFPESRCFPRARDNCRQLLDDLGLTAYDPLDICKITHGRQWDDYNWIQFDGEDVEYERDVKLRD